jgi:hypothetical protein
VELLPNACQAGRLQQLAVGEVADKGEVGGEEVVFGKFGERAPEHLLEDAVVELALEVADEEELDLDGTAVAVGVVNDGDALADGGIDAELFLKFADEGLLGGFAGFDLAAGELPLEAHGLIGAALADKELAGFAFAAEHEGRNDATHGLEGLCGAMTVEFADGLFHLPDSVDGRKAFRAWGGRRRDSKGATLRRRRGGQGRRRG